ncbi:nucleotidyltransferase family protein [Serpentinicella alkaliphila]|uniref:MobA-like NTP transferase protein n=1 Tax=Serpentinicella alkaliphila TaxID=1734049 RepID=A0A4R2TGT7_9FIRM|nr:nucleotidyltransferase family protein [Serpentinicella alkaliphila]QUH25332.1 NTP transferase domain-containing protein [Serpentinicella alkaliphila]TCQ02381.1 MobA-like NTP transferase protein [Serpentinicella alkaliphila]
MNAVILAGEDNNKKSDIEHKAGILINGIPMINYVINALEQNSRISRIIVVGNKQKLKDIIKSNIDIIDGNGSMFDNFKTGIDYLNTNEKALIVTCDIPLITTNNIDDFLNKAIESNGDLCYPIIHKINCEEKYSDLKRTHVTLKEGIFTGGNIILVNPTITNKIEEKARVLIKHRKNPIAMTYNLGVGFLGKLLTKQLSVIELENHLSKLLNIRAKAIVTSFPELGCDVDREEHLEKIKKYII